MADRLSRISETTAQYRERRVMETTAAYERKVIKKLLVGLGADRVALAVGKQEVESGEEEAYLTMAWLTGQYPSFPVLLQTRATWTPNIVDFFRVRSRKNSFWEVWSAVIDELGTRRAVGCIFPFPEVTGLGHGIVHNLELPYVGEDPKKEFMCMRRICADGTFVELELLDSFINRLRVKWEPS